MVQMALKAADDGCGGRFRPRHRHAHHQAARRRAGQERLRSRRAASSPPRSTALSAASAQRRCRVPERELPDAARSPWRERRLRPQRHGPNAVPEAARPDAEVQVTRSAKRCEEAYSTVSLHLRPSPDKIHRSKKFEAKVHLLSRQKSLAKPNDTVLDSASAPVSAGGGFCYGGPIYDQGPVSPPIAVLRGMLANSTIRTVLHPLPASYHDAALDELFRPGQPGAARLLASSRTATAGYTRLAWAHSHEAGAGWSCGWRELYVRSRQAAAAPGP